MKAHHLLPLVAMATLLASCLAGGFDSAEQSPGAPATAGSMPDRFAKLALPSAAPAPQAERKKADRSPLEPNADMDKAEEAEPADDSGGAEAAPATRSWFPETFLFEPLVLTDASGQASVRVRVPDRLTTWRVLGLAHARNGTQAGAETRFLGTLPAYVDPVLPAFFTVGDRLQLPLLAVNTSERPWTRGLTASISGAARGSLERTVTVEAGSNAVETLEVLAERAGPARLRAVLQGADAVERTVPVRPRGRPVSLAASGTLAAPRSVDLVGPADLDTSSATVRLQVFPGALALLRSELEVAGRRSGIAHDAYTLLLAGRAPDLLRGLKAEVDPDAIRKMRLVATQRAVRHARAPALPASLELAEAALGHSDSPVLERLGERLAASVAQAQRPDGTFGGGQGWTLQRVLVTTAEAVRVIRAGAGRSDAARRRSEGASVRAAGVFERHFRRVQDPYSAAAALASGAVEETLAKELAARVVAAAQQRPDGARELQVEEGVLRPDGVAPSTVEATALAVLGLHGRPDAPAWLADLGGALLAAYRPGAGWGDGRTNRLALLAVVALFDSPLPDRIEVELSLDGRRLTQGTLQAERLRDVVTLEALAPGAAGKHTWTVRAQPPVPGLGFSLELRTWVPWTDQRGPAGLELAVHLPQQLRAGQPAVVRVVAVAPASEELLLRQELPAGVQPDGESLDGLVAAGTISGYRTEDGAITLEVPRRRPGKTFQATYRVVPTLGGRLYASASSLALARAPERRTYLAPSPWLVR